MYVPVNTSVPKSNIALRVVPGIYPREPDRQASEQTVKIWFEVCTCVLDKTDLPFNPCHAE